MTTADGSWLAIGVAVGGVAMGGEELRIGWARLPEASKHGVMSS